MDDGSLERDYPKVWRDFRTRRMIHGLSWLAFAGVSAICIVSGVMFHLPLSSWPDVISILASAALVSVTYFWLRSLRCPRCHKDFFFMLAIYPIFLRDGCWHCGLSIYHHDAAQT